MLAVAPSGVRAADTSWTALGPFRGDIAALVLDPSNHLNVYAGTYKGGVFKSVDGGAHWATANTGFTGFSGSNEVFGLVIDPVSPTTLFAGTNQGVFKSVNAGASWARANTGITDIAIQTLAINPASPTTVYAGTVNAGVFKTTNDGTSWSPVNTGLTSTFVHSLVIDPTSPSTVYADAGGTVFKTTNAGAGWSPANSGLGSATVQTLMIDPASSQTLYAGTAFPNGLFKSINGGTSWVPASSGLGSGQVRSLAGSGQTWYAGLAFSGGLYKTTNGGTSWSESDTGITTFPSSENIFALAIDPTSPGTVYAGTGDLGIFQSQDGGATWSPANTGLTNYPVQGVAVDPTLPPSGPALPTIYLQGRNQVFKSITGGPWNETDNGLPFSGINPGTLRIDPGAPQILYVGTTSGLFRTTDGGNNWSLLSLASGTQPNVVAISDVDADVDAFVAGDNKGGIEIVENGSVIATDPPPPGLVSPRVTSTAIDPVTDVAYDAIVDDATGTVTMRSFANGTFANFPTTGLGTGSLSLFFHPLSHGGDLFGSQGSQTFRFDDASQTWLPIGSALPDPVSALHDPPGSLYAGLSGGGVYANANPTGGGTWTALNAGLGNRWVSSLDSFPGSGLVVAGTDGGGVYVIGSLPAQASFSDPTTLTGAVIATFDHPVKGINSTNVVLRVSGATTNLSGALKCRNAAGVTVSCASGPVTVASFQPASALIPGQDYTAQVNPSGASPVSDLGGYPAIAASSPFRASTSEQESSAAARYAWRAASDTNAAGGSYTVDHLAGARATFSFTGSAVSWITLTGPAQGLADVYIDGVLKGTFNQYSAAAAYNVTRSFAGLTSGSHTLLIVVKGQKGATAGTDTQVAVDAFQVGSTLYSTPTVRYGWQTIAAASAAGGHYARSDLARSSVALTFRGTAVSWYTVLGPNQGKASVYIDGILKGTFDNYAATTTYNAAHTVSGLSDTVHTLLILALGTKQTASTGTLVAIDRWAIN